MNKKIGVVLPFFLMFCLLLSPVHALFASWNGYVYIDSSLAPSGTGVTAHINNASAATATTNTGNVKTMPNNESYYIIDLECASGSNVSFKVWDIWSNVVDQTCTAGWHTNGTSYFNLSISTLSNGNACTYAGSCNSGFCVDGYCCNEACDGANEACNVAGSLGTCTSTVTATTTTTAATSPGGGGLIGTTTPATTTVATTAAAITTTTVPLDKIEELIVEEIQEGGEGTFTTTDEDELKVQEINVEVKNAVSNVQLTVTRTYTQPATIAIAAPDNVYTYLEIEKTNIEDEDITKATIRFKVEKSWIVDNNIDADTIALNRYSDGVWNELPTTKLSEDSDYVYFEVVSPGLSVFAITAKELPVTTTTAPVTTTTKPIISIPSTAWVFLGVTIVLIAIVIFSYQKGWLTGESKTKTKETSILDEIESEEGEEEEK